MPVMRLFLTAVVVSTTASCSIISSMFGGDRAEDISPYQSAMADFSLCETAVTPEDRAAAAARLANAASAMSAVTQPTDADHFYEADRVVAANARCQAVLSAP